MCKRRQITHKLNKEGLYIKFVRDSLVLYTSIKLKKKKKKKKKFIPIISVISDSM